MRLQIDQSNISWRRNLNTINNAEQNNANKINAAAVLGLTTASQNNMWQQYRDEAAWLVGTTESKLDRAHQFALLSQRADLAADVSYANSFQEVIGAAGNFALNAIFG